MGHGAWGQGSCPSGAHARRSLPASGSVYLPMAWLYAKPGFELFEVFDRKGKLCSLELLNWLYWRDYLTGLTGYTGYSAYGGRGACAAIAQLVFTTWKNGEKT
jgi:hypothetical protein